MNYLEHEIKVKYLDGLLAREQEWQWFIEYIEQNYDMIDVNSWNELLVKFKENANKALDNDRILLS